MQLIPIARIHTDFESKFGCPRQSGLVRELVGAIVFEPEYRDENALRALDSYSHLWLIWGFDVLTSAFSPTVRPPRLGGNERVGVFATRSPFRPNPLGLSVVRLLGIRKTQDRGTVLDVDSVDMMNGTVIYDIKPYLPYVDCVNEAEGALPNVQTGDRLQTVIPDDLLARIPKGKQNALISVLQSDIRPAYQENPSRRYGFRFAGKEVRFTVQDEILTVFEISDP